jgi:AbrB family looped-hinge helix DNA binding protein
MKFSCKFEVRDQNNKVITSFDKLKQAHTFINNNWFLDKPYIKKVKTTITDEDNQVSNICKVGNNGSITIPIHIKRSMNLNKGDYLEIVITEEGILLKKKGD